MRKHIKKEQSTDLGRVPNGTPYSLYSAFLLTRALVENEDLAKDIEMYTNGGVLALL